MMTPSCFAAALGAAGLLFYDFSLYGPVDDRAGLHRIHAYSSSGPDFATLPESAAALASADSVEVEFQLGWWEDGFGLAAASLRSLAEQMHKCAEHGHGATDRPFIMLGQSGRASIGIYMGQGLLSQGLSAAAQAARLLLHGEPPRL